MKSDAVIWRDHFDANVFHLGVKATHGYCHWTTLFCDSIHELFGKDTAEETNKLQKGEMKSVILTMSIQEN